jgi:hypothetical protein
MRSETSRNTGRLGALGYANEMARASTFGTACGGAGERSTSSGRVDASVSSSRKAVTSCRNNALS